MKLSIARKLHEHCSVFLVEILATVEEEEWQRHTALTKAKIDIFSDCDAAIKSLDLVLLMAKYFKIHLLWVSEDRNIPGNCSANDLARLGMTLEISRLS